MEDDSSKGGGSILETGKADRPVWLMKCPLVVARSWQSRPPSDNHPLAKVVQSIDPLQADSSSSSQFTMELTGAGVGDGPRNFSLNMTKDFVPMCIFSEADQGNVAVEGRVDHKFDMQPHHDHMEEYGRVCRERTNRSMVKNRQIQVIDNDRGVHMRPMPGMMGLMSKDKKKTAPMKASDMKRTRRDRGELEDIMFGLFERQSNWGLKQLVQETDQPAQFLKEILNELCVYNKRGANQGTYQLKPEYQRSTDGVINAAD